MVFHKNLSDSKSPQVSRILLGILADLNNAVVWTVTTRPVISKSSSPDINPLAAMPRAPNTIGIIVTFIFHIFFNSLTKSRYSFLFSHSFNFNLWSDGTAKSPILQVLSFLLIIIRSDRLAEIRFLSQNPKGFCVSHSPIQILGCAYYRYYYYYWIGDIFVFTSILFVVTTTVLVLKLAL